MENQFSVCDFFLATNRRASRVDLSQLPHLGIPRRPRPLRPIKNLPIRRKLQYLHIAQPISSRSLGHQLRRRMKPPRPALPVKRGHQLQIPLGRLATQLIRQRSHILLRQKRRLLRPRRTRQQPARDNRHQHCASHTCLPVSPTLAFRLVPSAAQHRSKRQARTTPAAPSLPPPRPAPPVINRSPNFYRSVLSIPV